MPRKTPPTRPPRLPMWPADKPFPKGEEAFSKAVMAHDMSEVMKKHGVRGRPHGVMPAWTDQQVVNAMDRLVRLAAVNAASMGGPLSTAAAPAVDLWETVVIWLQAVVTKESGGRSGGREKPAKKARR